MHLVNKQYLQKYVFVRKFFIRWEYDAPGFDVACFGKQFGCNSFEVFTRHSWTVLPLTCKLYLGPLPPVVVESAGKISHLRVSRGRGVILLLEPPERGFSAKAGLPISKPPLQRMWIPSIVFPSSSSAVPR